MVEGDGAVLSVCVCVRDMPSPIAVRASGVFRRLRTDPETKVPRRRYLNDDVRMLRLTNF